MKHLTQTLLLLISMAVYAAPPIIERDTGTYVVLGKDQQPTDVFYRLSQTENTWKMEGKIGNAPWKDISCEQSCQYQPTDAQAAASYLPPAMRENYDISCINNIAQAFCRYTLKSNPGQGGFVVVGLVTAQPTPILLRRISKP